MKDRPLTRDWVDPTTKHAYRLLIDSNGGVLAQSPLDGAPALDWRGQRRLSDAQQRLAEQFRQDFENLPPIEGLANPLAEGRPILGGFRKPHRSPPAADYWGRSHAAADEATAERLATARLLREADDQGKPRSHHLQDVAQAKGEKLSANAAKMRARAATRAGYAPGAPGYAGRSRHSSRHDR